MPIQAQSWIYAIAAVTLLTGCATNGELGFAGHPLDCAIGVGHSDCAPGSAGAARYARDGSTVTQDSLTFLAAARPFPRATPLGVGIIPVSNGDTVESSIDGEYNGWSGETIYKLRNEQVWQQAAYLYRYHYAYSPAVLIYSSPSGLKMHVSGDTGDDVSVRRLR